MANNNLGRIIFMIDLSNVA